ncbi:MAG: oxaloacetate-decarboxylating malate dehydrogenase, partial [Nitrospirae bacterium]
HRFPGVLLQWEDFAQRNARPLLNRYRDRLCTFNDDIQGTAAVALAGLLAAVRATGSRLAEQRVVVVGAGSAGTGISDQIAAAMIGEGLSEPEARSKFWLIDRQGLLHAGQPSLDPAQQRYVQPLEGVAGWLRERDGRITLQEVVQQVRPTILIGVSGQPGVFTEEIVRAMARHVERPIIFPLSNPTSKCEAAPADLVAWTQGRGLIATGSPFPEVSWQGRRVRVGQCNNAFIFPGVGLGVIAAGAGRVSDGMFLAAARALSDCSPVLTDPAASLFPSLEEIRGVSRRIALAVAAEAQRAGAAEPTTPEELERRVDSTMWQPRYPQLRRWIKG